MNLPRILLPLATFSGQLGVEFIVDTGFDGDIVLPPDIVRRLDSGPLERTYRMLADGTIEMYPRFAMPVDWFGESRVMEVVVMRNNPLLGATGIAGCHLSADMEEGGEVVIEFP